MTRRSAEIDDLIDDLRALAEASADDMNDGRPIGPMGPDFWKRIAEMNLTVPEETTEAEAAEIIRHYFDALSMIADGAADPVAVAEAALAFEPKAARLLDGKPISSAGEE